jgi:hypothetical protein
MQLGDSLNLYGGYHASKYGMSRGPKCNLNASSPLPHTLHVNCKLPSSVLPLLNGLTILTCQ